MPVAVLIPYFSFSGLNIDNFNIISFNFVLIMCEFCVYCVTNSGEALAMHGKIFSSFLLIVS